MERWTAPTAATKKIVVSIVRSLRATISSALYVFILYRLVSLAPSIRAVKAQPADTPHAAKYNSEGYVMFNEKGTVGKLCTENLNATLPGTEIDDVLQTAASSLCSLLTYT